MSRRRNTEPAARDGGTGPTADAAGFFPCGDGPAFLISSRPPHRRPSPVDHRYGAIAQLGERYNGIVEVTGSIPVGSTNLMKGLAGAG
jgi:hypothetical protein